MVTKEDEALLEWVIKERPFVADDLTKDLKIMRARLYPQPASRPERRDRLSSDAGGIAVSPGGEGNHSQNGTSATSRNKPWIIGGMILAVLASLIWYFRKARVS